MENQYKNHVWSTTQAVHGAIEEIGGIIDATDFGVPVLVFLNLIPKIYQDFKPLNISHYLADARAHQLPLVGGLDPEYFHDWTEILNRWGLLNQDTAFAFLVRLGAVALMTWTVKQAWTTPAEDYR